MVIESLINYIRDNLKRGYPADSIKQALTEQGWNPSDVNDAFNYVQGPRIAPEPLAPQASPYQPSQQQGQPAAYHMHRTTLPQQSQTPPAEQGSAQPAAPQQQAARTAPQQQIPPSRPTGVTVICVLGFIGAVLGILGGIALVFLSNMLVGILGSDIMGNGTAAAGGLFASLVSVMALVPIILGIVQIIAFFLLLKMKKIGFLLVIILGIVQIIFNVMTMNILLSPLTVVILIYLLLKRKLFVY